MTPCIAEDDLFELANGGTIGDAPALESHLADCAACSALLGTLLAAPGARDLAGTTLGPYRLDSLVGAGGMGEVYRAWDSRLHREVAVKVLSRDVAASPERVRRLLAEARAAAAIAHPNVVRVYDTGTADGIPYIVSELIAGESLHSMIARGAITRRTALDLGLQLARGLAAAHAKGVVHRDLKPSNLLVTGDGTLAILDFGLAKVLGERGGDATEPGTLLGTTGYLSPEQARGQPADARSDVFAAGAILYELLAGKRAFDGATFADRLSAVLRDAPPPLADRAGPIVARCLAKDPAERFQSAQDLAWALEGVRDTLAKPARAISRRTFLLGTATTGAAGVLLGRALSPPAPRTLAPSYRQVTFRHGRVASARFTGDGASLIYAASWEAEPLAIFVARRGTGGTRRLALPPAELLAVSATGELAISIGHRALEGFHQAGELALVPLEGGTPRRLGVIAQHADFTPDGAQLAIVRRTGARYALELPIGRTILEAGWISHPRISPDGKRVACLVHETPHDDRGDLVVMSRAGGPAVIARGWSSADGLAWAPAGDAIWISASRTGGNNMLWSIALDGSERAHVASAGRVRVNDVSADGRIAISHVSGRLRMHAKPPGAASELDLALSDVSLVADLSADGRWLAFTELGDVDTANGAFVRTTDGGEPLRLGDVIPFDLADDGRGLLAGIGDPLGLVIVPLAGRMSAVSTAGLVVRSARWLDGERVAVGGGMPGRPPRLWLLERGVATQLTEEGVFGDIAVSPDRRRVALIAAGALLVVSVHDGVVQRVANAFDDTAVCGWHVDGRSVFVRGLAAPIAIRRVDLATGSAVTVRELVPPPLGFRRVASVAVDHAGDAYAYSYSQELSRLHVMTLT